jgi:hypothetical protein
MRLTARYWIVRAPKNRWDTPDLDDLNVPSKRDQARLVVLLLILLSLIALGNEIGTVIGFSRIGAMLPSPLLTMLEVLTRSWWLGLARTMAVTGLVAIALGFGMAVPMFAVLTLATILLFAILRTDLRLSSLEAYTLLGAYVLFVSWIIAETIGITHLIRGT